MASVGQIAPHTWQPPSPPGTACEEGRSRSAVREQPVRFLVLGAWFGLLTGFAELSFLAVKKFLLRGIIYRSQDVIWMAPLANLLIFAIPGLILSLLAWRWPRLVPLRIGVFIFAFLGFLSLLLHAPLYRYAALLLALGLAMQMTRFIEKHAHGFYALVRRTTGWTRIFNKHREQKMHQDLTSGGNPDSLVSRRQVLVSTGATIAGLALGVHGWRRLAEGQALAKLPTAVPDAPNVLLIVLDTVRAQNLSLYGYTRSTSPQLERLAKTGVVFERALSTAPWTLPSHASMFTGRFPHEMSADWMTPLDATHPTLAGVLSARGYLTAGFVANTIYGTSEHGLNRGFVHYEAYLISPGELVRSASLGRTIAGSHSLRRIIGYYEVLGRKTAPELNDGFLRWLSRHQQRPFFAFLNYYDAHSPYLPPEAFARKFGSNKRRGNPWLVSPWKWSPQEIQAELDAYDGSIAHLDHHVGLLFNELEKRRVLQNTLVIITSDHGEEFGEHGVMGHGSTLYLPSLQVPLLILFPSRLPAPSRVREFVSLCDLPATVIELLGLASHATFPGNSLSRYWNETRASSSPVPQPLLSEVNFAPRVPDWYPVSKGDMKSLIADRYHYIKNGDGREELYDFHNDPLETHDLARTAETRRQLERFRILLDAIPDRN